MTKKLKVILVAVVLFVLMAVMPASAAAGNETVTNQGATVFIGEQGLNLTHVLNQAGTSLTGADLDTTTPANVTIGWWASAAQIASSVPTRTINLGVGTSPRYLSMTVAPSDFVGFPGNWYVLSGTKAVNMDTGYISVADPSLSIAVWDFNQNSEVTGKSIPQGEALGFQVYTNMYPALDGTKRFNPIENGGPYPDAATDGYITIKVKDTNGATYSALKVNTTTSPTPVDYALARQFVNTQPWFFGRSDPDGFPQTYLVTDAVDFNNQYLYPVGLYTAWAESTLNRMKDNYKNAGADYTGKTVSEAGTVTLVSDSVKIEANTDSVVRSKSFSITVTGKPATTYQLWIKGTSTMDCTIDTSPPWSTSTRTVLQ